MHLIKERKKNTVSVCRRTAIKEIHFLAPLSLLSANNLRNKLAYSASLSAAWVSAYPHYRLNISWCASASLVWHLCSTLFFVIAWDKGLCEESTLSTCYIFISQLSCSSTEYKTPSAPVNLTLKSRTPALNWFHIQMIVTNLPIKRVKWKW